ncbi:MAG: hypothetical protein ABIF11_02250 [Nitrospirota bacterium]
MNSFHLGTRYLKLNLRRFTGIIHLTGLVITRIFPVVVFNRIVMA